MFSVILSENNFILPIFLKDTVTKHSFTLTAILFSTLKILLVFWLLLLRSQSSIKLSFLCSNHFCCLCFSILFMPLVFYGLLWLISISYLPLNIASIFLNFSSEILIRYMLDCITVSFVLACLIDFLSLCVCVVLKKLSTFFFYRFLT